MSDRTPFHSLDEFVALPRVGGLLLSPDGSRLVTSVSGVSGEGKRRVTSLWQLDPTGERPAHRLTRSAKGEQQPTFLPDGTLLFTSARPDAEAEKPSEDDPPALWALPAGTGEARVVARRPGGIAGPLAATGADVVAMVSATMPAATTAEEDEERRAARKDRAINAILHTGYPVRSWDHDLGPDEPRVLVGRDLAGVEGGRAPLTDLTPSPGRRFHETTLAITPDGRTVLATASVPERGGSRSTLVAIDAESGSLRTLLDEPGTHFGAQVVDPGGTRTIVVRETNGDDREPPTRELLLLDLADGSTTALVPDWDRWPHGFCWTPDGAAVLCVADEGGAAPVFRIDVERGDVTRLTTDHGSYDDVQVSPDGATAYAVRSAVDHPPAVVRLDARSAGEATLLRGPTGTPALPGSLASVETTASDGTPLRAWIALPDGAADEPAPLLLWIHGGPLSSWNAWSWRWCPWLAVARGYAVLLPDPALSTGYGHDFVRRGWGRWGDAPYHDLLALTDVAEDRPDIDAGRTAAMGGSFGGYMANWVAGHTDRFDAIVSHAGLWALDQFTPTTDRADYWRREMTDEMAARWSPHHSVGEITTPMLVIHGDKDYRVPIGEGLRLWSDLVRHHTAEDGSLPHTFLYFPDEHHWVLGPHHARVWYETVFAFLAHHVLGEDWVTPEHLR